MTPDQAARTLGEVLANSPEFADLVACEKAYAADSASQSLVRAAQTAGARIQELQKSGRKLEAAEARRIAEVQANLDACTIVQRLVASQKAYDALAQKLNGVVQAVVEEKRKNS
ncbi:MAG: YlbF family regulator [Planctomycetes bacterium]|nr:YlbF family regulator [Planctomycetota bacterium]